MKRTCQKFTTRINDYYADLDSAVGATFNCKFHITLINKL
jgi:hypothetical protein